MCLNFSYGQNCTVNAGVDASFCLYDSISLVGFKAGLLSGSTRWTQVSGPSAIINAPNSLATGISGVVPGTYVFNLRSRCADGSNANDQVTLTILNTSKAKAGKDTIICPSNGFLNGNTPGSGETGAWSFVQNNGHVNINNNAQAKSAYSITNSNGGVSILRWTITNTNGCSSFDDVTITNYGGVMPVRTADSITLSPCYSVTTSTGLYGSFAGKGLGGQSGTWNVLSGPNMPNVGNQNSDSAFASNLIPGVYRFEYVVSGPCANGRDTLQVRVPPPLGALSPSGGFSVFLCDRPTSIVLNGSPPIYVNDVCSWSQISGPSTVTFNPNNTASTTVTGLRGIANDIYQFSYMMNNPVTGCIQNNLVTVTYIDTPQLYVFPDRILNCNQDTAIIRFTYSGGRNTVISQLSGLFSTIGTAIFTDTLSSFVRITDLNNSGTYTYRIQRNSGFGQGCANIEDDIKIIVSRQPGIANAGSSQRLNCNVDTTELAGNIPTEGVGHWYQNYGPSVSEIEDSLNNITVVRNLDAGRYQYRWLIDGGQSCNPTQDDVTVFVADTLPVAAAGGIDQNICFLSVLHLSGNVPPGNSFGVWSVLPDSGIVFDDSTSYNARVTGLDSNKVYSFVWRVYNACGSSTDTVLITVNSNVAAIPANAGNDRCLPDTTSIFQLSGNQPWPGTGKWRKIYGPQDSIVNDTLYNSFVIPSGPGHYAYTWSIGNGICDDGVDTVRISIADSVTIAKAGRDIDTCADNLILRGNQPINGIGQWSLLIGRVNGNMLYPDSFETPVLSLNQGTYIYRWTIRNGVCGNSHDDVKVNIANPTTIPFADTGRIWCNPSSITLGANRITKGHGYWSLSGINPNTPGISPRDSANATVSGMIAGIYAFKWNSVNPMGICPDLYSMRYDTIIFPANAGTDMRICKVYNVQLNGGVGSKGYWRKLSGGTVTLDTTGDNSAIANSMNSAGSPYKFIFDVIPNYGCGNNSDTITIEVFDSTKTPFAGIDQNLCDGDTFFLSGNNVAPDSGLWSQVSGPSSVQFSNFRQYNSKAYNVQGGSYLFKWTSQNLGCVKSDFVVIRNYDSSVTALAGNDTIVCPPSAQLKAIFNATNTALWNQISGPNNAQIQSGVNPTTKIFNLSKGTYQFEWVVNNGICPPSRDTVEISVPYDQPTSAVAGSNQLYCQEDTIILSGNVASIGQGKWRQLFNSSVNIVDDTLSNSAITIIDTGKLFFEWKISNGNCSNADTVELYNYPEPTQPVCQDDTGYCLYVPVTINANSPTIGRGAWTALGNTTAIVLSPNNSTSVVAGLNAGAYQFEWAISNGTCPIKADTLNITIDSIPSLADAGPDINTCLIQVNMQALRPASGIGTWRFISGMSTPSIVTPNSDTSTIYNLDSGKYVYEWEVGKGGCTNKDSMSILMEDPQANDQCLQPIEITDPGGTYYGDLCGAKRFGAEPDAYGYQACNTIFYRFKTTGYNYVKSITLDFTTMNNCPFGLRVSLFDSAACPGLGVQHDTTIIVNSPGYIQFDSLKSNQAYILVIDENRNPCSKTDCNIVFRAQGNALPVKLVNFEVKKLQKRSALINWTTTHDAEVVSFELWKMENGVKVFLKRLQASGAQIANYSYTDNNINFYPVEYIVYANTKGGLIQEIGRRTLYDISPETSFTAFPNPTNNSFKISCLEPEKHRNTTVHIYNSEGQLTYSVDHFDMTQNQDINLGTSSAGIYYAVVYSNGKMYKFKLLKY